MVQGRRPALLPSPGVAFSADFLPRLGRLTARMRGRRERREGAGGAHLLGVGAEFVGYRPYRPGEDLRQLDWSLYARMRRPFVRIARREASEHWAVLVDSSGSMGVGRPGKFQRAAEVATAIAAEGIEEGATVELLLSGTEESVRLRRRAQLTAWMKLFERTEACGDAGLARLVAEAGRFRHAGGLFLVGDFLDLEPRDVMSLGRRGRDLFLTMLLAPEELSPPSDVAVRWVDAETGSTRTLEIDRGLRSEYEARLGRRLESWGASAARHRASFSFHASTRTFESIVGVTFGGN